MNTNKYKHISKLMSLGLRHQPDVLGLEMNDEGWVSVPNLLKGLTSKGKAIDFETLQDIVNTNDKKRFAFNEDKTMIRASQGHSIKVDLKMKIQTPPPLLYHGTVAKFMRSILLEGLKSMSRQHVHLSADIDTATKVGSRRGVPIILEIDTNEMVKKGHDFFLSDNDVWLTTSVPAEYISKQ